MITEVKIYNAEQRALRDEYLKECKSNGVDPQSNLWQKHAFPTFNYKSGYVKEGKYPRYNRVKRNLI